MKYNVGDKVRIKTFEELADGNKVRCDGTIEKGHSFTKEMRKMCGKEVTIEVVEERGYLLEEDTSPFPYTYEDWMFEEVLVKEFKFKVGDVVKIVGQFANHGFELGEVVEVMSLPSTKHKEQWYFCRSLTGYSYYYVDERDMEYDEDLISMDKEKVARKVLDGMFVDDLYSGAVAIEDDFDVVDKPRHYADKKIEVINYIQDTVDFLKVVGYEAYCIGNVIKYVSRYAHKNGVEDLKKARYYLQEVIDILEVD